MYNTLLKTGIEPINYGIPFWVKNLTASPITFQITSDVNITSFDFEFEKSDDLSSWVSIGNMGTAASNPLTTTIPANGRVYFRALTNSYHAMQNYDRYSHISCSGSFEIGGNIMSLLKGSTFTGQETTLPASQCFKQLFQNATTLVKADELLLPANTLTSSCYESMFVGCSALVYAPKLPATTLASYCYKQMFNGCTSMTVAPELQVSKLQVGCYQYMFSGCTGLRSIPALESINISQYAYGYMFANCSNLTSIPKIHVNTVANEGMNSMFTGCTKLAGDVEIEVDGSVSGGAFSSMFNNTKITGATVKINNIGTSGCSSMFYGITTLRSAEISWNSIENSTSTNNAPLGNMFNGCSSLNYVDCQSVVSNTDTNAYQWMNGVASTGTFVKNIDASWTTGANGIPANWTVEESGTPVPEPVVTNSTPFYIQSRSIDNTITVKKSSSSATSTKVYKSDNGTDWTVLTNSTTTTGTTVTVPAGEILYLAADGWNSDQKLTCSAPFNTGGNMMSLVNGTDFVGQTDMTGSSFYGMFQDSMLKSAKNIILPATTLASSCYASMFQNTDIDTAPALPATTLASSCYNQMFRGCSKLTTAPSLPATTLTASCYSGMFNGCRSLTTAPALPATTLPDSCYNNMFRDCTSLTTAPAEINATSYSYNACGYMFYGCTSLTTAPVLSGLTLNQSCNQYMFTNCSSLNSITCYATNASSANHCYNWTSGVAATGTFTKFKGATWPTGANGIPSGWTVEELDIEILSVTPSPNTFYAKSYDSSVDVEGTLTVVYEGGITATYGFTDTFSIGENTGSETRTITETCYYEGMPYNLSIIQSANDEKATLTTPFYVEDATGSDNTLSIKKNNNGATTLTIEKSLDGSTWETMGTTSTTDITATVPANGRLYLRCNTNNWGGYYYNYMNCSGKFNVGGNAMSLLYGSNFTGAETVFPSNNDRAFASMLSGSKVVSAEYLYLPATTLTTKCYYGMFQNCSNLKRTPMLPASTLVSECYGSMFYYCTKITSLVCLATDISAYDCIYRCLPEYATVNPGILYKSPSLSSWPSDRLPPNWTVQNYSA